jgi:hypothetical protein
MRFAIISILTAAATLATVSSVFARDDQRVPRAATKAPSATKNAATQDAATGNVPGLITSEQQKEIPYRARDAQPGRSYTAVRPSQDVSQSCRLVVAQKPPVRPSAGVDAPTRGERV